MQLHLSGPTVTLFGGGDALDVALGDELGRRGCSTHAVSTSCGWLESATNVVMRLDSRAGQDAMTDLLARDARAAHVVAVCATGDGDLVARLDAMSRRCGDRHDVSMIWHSPLGLRSATDGSPVLRPAELAASIADEIGHQEAWTTAPSFTTQTFEPGRHRRHP